MTTPTNAEIEAAQARALRDSLLREQKLAAGALTGLLAACVAAVVWAAITLFSGYQIGWMAIGVGFLVGITVRHFGRGVQTSFALIGAALSLFGCALGNVLVAVIVLWRRDAMGFNAALDETYLRELFEIVVETFRPLDLLFYAIAVYEGYKLSYRQLPPPANAPAAV